MFKININSTQQFRPKFKQYCIIHETECYNVIMYYIKFQSDQLFNIIYK